MIITLFLNVVVAFLGGILSFFPAVTELPFGIDGYLTTAVGYFQRIEMIFPPLGILMTMFLIYIGFRITLLALKLFLGNRAPIYT